MYCSKCGCVNDETAKFCQKCGSSLVSDVDRPYRDSRPLSSPHSASPGKERWLAILLCFFLGCWGIHKFYLRQQGQGVAMMLIGLIGLFALVPLLVTGVWSLVNLLQLLFMGDEQFNRMYN